MTLHQFLKELLTPTASGGAWAIEAADNCPAPFVVFNVAGNPINNAFDGPSDLQPARIQVDCYAATLVGCKTVEAAVTALLGSRTALIGSPLAVSSLQIDQIDLFDRDRKLFRSMLEFSLWRV